MKATVTFVLFLLCSFLNGFGLSHPIIPATHPASKAAGRHIYKAETAASDDHPFFKSTSSAEDDDDVSFIDDDDQDDVNEHASTERDPIVFYHLYTSGSQYVLLCPTQPVGQYITCCCTRTFIFHRVLRI